MVGGLGADSLEQDGADTNEGNGDRGRDREVGAVLGSAPPIMPGLGVEPRRPEGHPILSRARMTSFATPAGFCAAMEERIAAQKPALFLLASRDPEGARPRAFPRGRALPNVP